MKAIVSYDGDRLPKDFPDDMGVGTKIRWSFPEGYPQVKIQTVVKAITPLETPEQGATHLVEIELE